MALLEVDFQKAIEGFVSAWRVSLIGLDGIGSGGSQGEQRDWDDVQVAEKVSQRGFLARSSQRVSDCV